MKRLWTDSLFLFAVVAGAVFEFVYEPIRMVAGWGVRAAVRAGTRTRRRISGYSHSRTA